MVVSGIVSMLELTASSPQRNVLILIGRDNVEIISCDMLSSALLFNSAGTEGGLKRSIGTSSRKATISFCSMVTGFTPVPPSVGGKVFVVKAAIRVLTSNGKTD